MSPRRTNTNSHDGLNSSCSTHGVTSVPLRPHHVDHPLDEQYLHVSANEHPDESGSDGLPGTEPSARTTHRHTSSNDNARQQKTNGRNQRMMNKNREEDVAGLISENHELRQQTMALSLELADALTKIDELEQQNRKLLKLHEQHTCRTNNASQEVSSETCLDYQEEMKPARPPADNVNAHQSSGEGMGHLRSSLVGTASVRNIFSSLKGEAEATAPVTTTATATTTANKRSSFISMARSSIYSGSGRSHQSRHDSHSSISINDESSESLSLHPDDVEGQHPPVEADERSSWLQRFSESLPVLNRGEILAESSALSCASNNSYALPACTKTPASMRQPESSVDEFVIPLKEGTGGDGGDAGEGMTRNNTDKDVQDFFRRMSVMENSDGESDAESLAGGENADWSEFAKTAKTTKTLSAEDTSKRENNFSSIASQLIADATFDLYKSTDA